MAGNDAVSGRRSRGRPRSWDDKSAQNVIKSLDRAMEVFAYLGQSGGVTLTELAHDLDQAPATIYRILVTLERHDLVEFDAQDQDWHIGSNAFLIGSRFLRRTSLVDRARPIMRTLMERTGETANLGVERAGQVLFVSQVETHANIRAFFPPGTLSRFHASGIGKVLLAWMPEDRRRALIEGAPLERFTPHTVVRTDALMRDLQAARERGYAIDAEERTLGMRCIAAPVFDVHGEVRAGLSVSGPTSRIDAAAIGTLGRAVRDAAAALTAALGGASIPPPP